MAIPLKLDSTTLKQRQFTTTDDLQIDDIIRRAGSGNMTIGSNLGAAEELILGSATSDVRILGDLIVDGSSTISVDETVVGTFTVEGDVNLGDGTGDTINLGGGTSDIVNLESDLVLGAGIVGIGSSVTDYLSDLWLVAVNNNGPNNDAYNLRASGTNAGAYSIGVDPTGLTYITATDLQTALSELDAAIGAASGTLQQAYEAGNTISVTTAEGAIQFSNTTDATNVLELSKSGAFGGNVLNVTTAAASTGVAVFVNNSGTGNALQVQDAGSDVLVVSAAGAVTATPTSGQSFTATVAGAGVVDINTGAGGVTVDATGGGISLDAGAASNFTTSAGALVLESTAADVDINAGTAVTIDAAGAISLDAGASSNFTTTVGNIVINAAAIIDIDGGSAVNIDAVTGMSLDAGAASNFSTSAGNLTLSAVADDLILNAGTDATLDAAGVISIDAGAASNFSTSAGDLTFDAAAAELVFDDVGNSATTLSQSADRVFDETGAGEVLNGATSLLGAINRLARRVTVATNLTVELPIENTVTIAAGNCVAASTVAGRVTNATSAVGGNFRFIGICLVGGTGDAGGTVLARFAVSGYITDSGAAFTAGAALYVPETAGRPVVQATLTLDEGDMAKQIAYAISATTYVLAHGLPETII